MVWPVSRYSTTGEPLDAHLAHLRHMARVPAARVILRDRHGYSLKESDQRARVIASHIRQAIDFFSASRNSPPSVSPVSQYYCYLNLAVAVREAFRKSNQAHSRSHGVHDKTAELSKMGLASEVVQVSKGAVPDFHEIVGSTKLSGAKLSMRDLAVSFPLVHAELWSAYKIKTNPLELRFSVYNNEKQDPGKSWPQIQALLPNAKPSAMLRTATVKKLVPAIGDHFDYQHGKGATRTYRWPTPFEGERAKSRARTALNRVFLPLANFGAHAGGSFPRRYVWYYSSDSICLPMLSAGLILAFVGASLARYRPGLLQGIHSSRYSLLFDVFQFESPGVMIPGMRNLLYREQIEVASNVAL